MKPITFDRFEVGLDLRKGASVADANRLRVLTNAYVTTGKVVQRRPGLTRVADLEAGTIGLVAGLGKLHTFTGIGSVTHANALFQSHPVLHPTATQAAQKIHHGDVFNGALYVSVEYADGSIRHHHLDGSTPTHVADANCPNLGPWRKVQGKIWGIGDEVVRYTSDYLSGGPRDWTTAANAGFVGFGVQASGNAQPTALGVYRGYLVAFAIDAAQVWLPDVDPDLIVLRQTIENAGTQYPESVVTVAGDVLFLSPAGYRSIAIQGASDNLADFDVGSPIDTLVTPLLVPGIAPLAAYYPKLGQYWCFIGSTAHVYTYSRTAKISAWSVFEFSFAPDAIAQLNGELYLRHGDRVYRVDDTADTDDGTAFSGTIELPFLDFKSPGALKHVIGMDAVFEGAADVAFRFDARSPDLISAPVTLSGDTRPGGMVPVELVSAGVAPVITFDSTEFERMDLLTFYFENLGVV